MNADVTWGDVYKDFEEHFPNISQLSNDYRPYAQYTIIIWLKTGIAMTYNYETKELKNNNE